MRLASSDSSARLTWNSGIFYSHTDENIPEYIYDQTLNSELLAYTGGAYSFCTAALPCPGGQIGFGPVDQIIEKQLAAFGELTFKFTDTIKATAGLRVSRIDQSGAIVAGGPFAGVPLITVNASTSETPVTPKFALIGNRTTTISIMRAHRKVIAPAE